MCYWEALGDINIVASHLSSYNGGTGIMVDHIFNRQCSCSTNMEIIINQRSSIGGHDSYVVSPFPSALFTLHLHLSAGGNLIAGSQQASLSQGRDLTQVFSTLIERELMGKMSKLSETIWTMIEE